MTERWQGLVFWCLVLALAGIVFAGAHLRGLLPRKVAALPPPRLRDHQSGGRRAKPAPRRVWHARQCFLVGAGHGMETMRQQAGDGEAKPE